MGLAMKSETRKATKSAKLRLTADEARRLKDAAAKAGLAVGTFVKQRLYGKRPAAISRGDTTDKGGKRDQLISLRLTPNEHAVLVGKAESTELSVSEFMRYRVFRYKLPEAEEGEQLTKEVMRTLGLAKHIHNVSEGAYSDLTADIVNHCRKLTVMLIQDSSSVKYEDVLQLREAGAEVVKAQNEALGNYWPETEEALQALLLELFLIKDELR